MDGDKVEARACRPFHVTFRYWHNKLTLKPQYQALNMPYLDGIFNRKVQSQVREARFEILKEAVMFQSEIETAREVSEGQASAPFK